MCVLLPAEALVHDAPAQVPAWPLAILPPMLSDWAAPLPVPEVLASVRV